LGSRDGWEIAKFRELIFKKGPTLIIVKTTKGRICGGYTSKNWDADKNRPVFDTDAFVFSVDTNTKYLPTNGGDKGIWPDPNGIIFGSCILDVRSDNKLNDTNEGRCYVGAGNNYNIEGD
jgi:hypothetical protein